MGNGLVFRHRLPAICAASISTLGLALTITAGTTCSFIRVLYDDPHNRDISDPFVSDFSNTLHVSNPTSRNIGQFCTSPHYSIDDDTMWKNSRFFLIAAIVLSSLSTALAWAISTIVPPTDRLWRIVSIANGLCAVGEIPVFLIFESIPCTLSGQKCMVSTGSFLLICSIVCYITVTILTQYHDTPKWDIILNEWRVNRKRQTGRRLSLGYSDESSYNDEYDENLLLSTESQRFSFRLNKSLPSKSIWEKLKSKLFSSKYQHCYMEDKCMTIDMTAAGAAFNERNSTNYEKGKSQRLPKPDGSYYAKSDNSRLLLHVTPNGHLLGDDRLSDATFEGSLDEDLLFAESERKEKHLDRRSPPPTSLPRTSSPPSSSPPSSSSPPPPPMATTHITKEQSMSTITANDEAASLSGKSKSSMFLPPEEPPPQFAPAAQAAFIQCPDQNNIQYSDPKLFSSKNPSQQNLLDDDHIISRDSIKGSNYTPNTVGKKGGNSNEKAISFNKKSPTGVDMFDSVMGNIQDVDAGKEESPYENNDLSKTVTVIDFSDPNDTNKYERTKDLERINPLIPDTQIYYLSQQAETNNVENDEERQKSSSSISLDMDVLLKAAAAGENAAKESNEIFEDPPLEAYMSDGSASTITKSDHSLSDTESDYTTSSMNSKSETQQIILAVQSRFKKEKGTGSKRLRTKRKKRRKKLSSSSSVSSQISLLDLTIDEETDRDLELEEAGSVRSEPTIQLKEGRDVILGGYLSDNRAQKKISKKTIADVLIGLSLDTEDYVKPKKERYKKNRSRSQSKSRNKSKDTPNKVEISSPFHKLKGDAEDDAQGYDGGNDTSSLSLTFQSRRSRKARTRLMQAKKRSLSRSTSTGSKSQIVTADNSLVDNYGSDEGSL